MQAFSFKGRILQAKDWRSQTHTLAYVPTNRKRDGTYRVLQVKASAPSRGRMSVRTRTGYYAPLEPQPFPGRPRIRSC
jgi:hypothetical protein